MFPTVKNTKVCLFLSLSERLRKRETYSNLLLSKASVGTISPRVFNVRLKQQKLEKRRKIETFFILLFRLTPKKYGFAVGDEKGAFLENSVYFSSDKKSTLDQRPPEEELQPYASDVFPCPYKPNAGAQNRPCANLNPWVCVEFHAQVIIAR